MPGMKMAVVTNRAECKCYYLFTLLVAIVVLLVSGDISDDEVGLKIRLPA